MKGFHRSGEEQPFPAGEAILFFAVFFLPGLFPGLAGPDPSSFDSIAWNLYLVAGLLPQVLLLAYLITLRYPGSRRSFGLRKPGPESILNALYAFSGAVLILFGIGLVVTLIPGIKEFAARGAFSWKLSRPELLPFVTVSSITAGYREELYFRAYLLTLLRASGISVASSAAVSSALFAVCHLYEGPLAAVAAFAAGIFFSFLFFRTSDLHGLAVGHGLYNTAALSLSMFS